jgi:hypothetical protein
VALGVLLARASGSTRCWAASSGCVRLADRRYTPFVVVLGVGPAVRCPRHLAASSSSSPHADGVRQDQLELAAGCGSAGPPMLALRMSPAPFMIMAGCASVPAASSASSSGVLRRGGGPYLIVKYGNDLDMERVYATVLWIVLASVLLNVAFARVERSFVTWRPV